MKNNSTAEIKQSKAMAPAETLESQQLLSNKAFSILNLGDYDIENQMIVFKSMFGNIGKWNNY
jgi:hypothetical protein